jgi:glutamate-1-semialdehyde aminotransferase/acyl carrier protein
LPIVSTATGTWLTDSEATNPDYWASHLRHPVRFATALATLREDAERVLVEVGPRKTLTTLALQRQPGTAQPAVRALACWSDAATENAEKTSLLDVVGRLWTSGVPVDFASFFRDQRRRRIALPGYSFEPERHWLEAPRTPIVHVAPRAPSTNSIDSSAVISPPSSETVPMSSANASRKPRLVEELKTLFEQVSGLDFRSADESANFMELGVDSLLVTQLATRVKNTYRVPVSFRQLMEEYSSLTALSEYLDAQLPAEATPPPAAPVVAAPAVAVAAASAPVHAYPASAYQAPAVFAAPPPAFVPANGSGDPLGVTRQMLQLQMAQLDLLQRQLALVGGQALPSGQALPAGQPLVNGQLALAAAPEAQPASAPGSQVVAKAPETERAAASEPSERVEYDPKKAFGAIARIYKQSDELTPQQEARLAALVQRYTAKTKSSKAHTQEYRAVHADPRVVTGFKPRIKELIYPIVTARSEGCHLWDLDGNEFVDALNGFGSNFFGYSAKRIADALHRQIDTGYEIGPQTTLAGESAKMVCQLTGLDRAAFCNTGSEAVMGALRIARTVTGRQLVVAFSGSYHGIFDEVIVRDTKTMRSIPAAPGIMPESVANILVLEYGTEKSLQIIRERGDEIAAVLVEPVQSRRPDFQPKEFLKQVREATRASGSALIFDEVITGFRAQPGGAQAYYGIEADLATYGKVVGGGMPIGVIAGRNPWMDALDGGYWQFGDSSIPTAGVTYFAGTFVRHPLAMAAVHAALSIMIEEGPALQERVNAKTTRLATELNAFFKSVSVPLEIRHFASLWKTFVTEPQPYSELLFLLLRDRGVHIYDGFPCFMTVAHTEADVTFIIDAFKSAVAEMQAAGFLPGGATTSAPQMDASKPPVTGARLGRDAQGNPAWFVPDPNASGKYLQLT